ncbi:glutaredoxin family protein [Thermithiobacillus tepidarius DSM 3134]|uniref:glutaredoxin family protein n=1 Tax=Thermithiobacillus tepidarius TaxID=929 RepID=UPI000422BE30|nr:glutaredoxin family protein [Thermithiobacillus tepidarius]
MAVSGAVAPVTLRLLGRPECHLCTDMLALLQPYLAGGQVQLELVDVDSDPALAARYGLLIPVLLAGEQELARYVLDPTRLSAFLQAAGCAPAANAAMPE